MSFNLFTVQSLKKYKLHYFAIEIDLRIDFTFNREKYKYIFFSLMYIIGSVCYSITTLLTYTLT